MSLSKDNLDKLNTFINDKDLLNNSNNSDNKITNKNHKESNELSKLENPNNIFYSLIDNSETLTETSKVNHLLRNSEKKYENKNSTNTYYSKNLTIEDELYDQFNYFLEE